MNALELVRPSYEEGFHQLFYVKMVSLGTFNVREWAQERKVVQTRGKRGSFHGEKMNVPGLPMTKTTVHYPWSQPMATSKQRLGEVLQTPNIVVHMFRDDGTFPNNEKLPLVLYQGAIKLSSRDPASTVEEIFYAHGWGGSWRNGIYPYHHYHSTAHEVLGVSRGSATVRLGGATIFR